MRLATPDREVWLSRVTGFGSRGLGPVDLEVKLGLDDWIGQWERLFVLLPGGRPARRCAPVFGAPK
jgi:hypothetical protein